MRPIVTLCALCVCLLDIATSCAKTDEPIDMLLFGMWTRVEPRIRWGPGSLRGKDSFFGGGVDGQCCLSWKFFDHLQLVCWQRCRGRSRCCSAPAGASTKSPERRLTPTTTKNSGTSCHVTSAARATIRDEYDQPRHCCFSSLHGLLRKSETRLAPLLQLWHVSSRSGVATLRTAIHLLLTYLLTPRTAMTNQCIGLSVAVGVQNAEKLINDMPKTSGR